MRYIKGDLSQRTAKSNEGMDFFKNISEDQEKKLNDAVGKMLSKNKNVANFWKKKVAVRIEKRDIKERLSALNADLKELLEKIKDKEKTKLNKIIEQLGNKKKPKKKKSKKKKSKKKKSKKKKVSKRGRSRARFFNGGRRSRRRSRRRSSRRRFR